MQVTHDSQDAHPDSNGPRELDLFAVVFLLVNNWRLILGITLLSVVGTTLYMATLKPKFSSIAVLITPQGSIGAAQSRASFDAASLFGSGPLLLYADMLKSRSVADRIIHDFNLQKTYGTTTLEGTEKKLIGSTKVEIEREGLISIEVLDVDAQRASDIANDYGKQLEGLNSHLVLTSVGQERKFLEGELADEKNQLANAEVALKQVQETTKGLPPETQANASFNALEGTRAQLRVDQVRLDAMLTGDAESNPEVTRLRKEIESLSSQIASLEHGAVTTETGMPTSQAPSEVLEYTRRLRDVKFHETLFDLIEREYEQAKEKEAQEPNIVEVLDPARPALHKSWPHRMTYLLIGSIGGFLAGVFFVCLKALFTAYASHPRNADKLHRLKMIFGAKAQANR